MTKSSKSPPLDLDDKNPVHSLTDKEIMIDGWKTIKIKKLMQFLIIEIAKCFHGNILKLISLYI